MSSAVQKTSLKINQFEAVEELICFPYSLNDKYLYCHDLQILISDNLVSYHVMFYTLRKTFLPIFDSRVFVTLVPGTDHPNYYHSSQTLGCEVPILKPL